MIKLTRYEAKLLSTLVIIKLEDLHNEKVDKIEKLEEFSSLTKRTSCYKFLKNN